MASVIARGGKWQAKIRKNGFPPATKTFLRQIDAEAWARKTESEMERGIWRDSSEAEATTLLHALERYEREVTISKKSAKRESTRIRAWKTHKLASRSLASIRGKDIADFRDSERRRGLAENSIRLDIALISHVFETARREWGFETLVNPCRLIKLPASSKPRNRRLEEGEETRLLNAITKTMSRTPCVSALIKVALETGMRQGELLRLNWSDVDLRRGEVHLDETKSGDPRDVPLSPAAISAISALPRPIGGGRIFEISQDRLVRGMSKACKEAGINDFRFHDLRHKAASRLAPRMKSSSLAKMFGWKTIQMAMRYYHPRAEDLARELGFRM